MWLLKMSVRSIQQFLIIEMKNFGLCAQLHGHRDAVRIEEGCEVQVRCCVFLDTKESPYFAATGGLVNVLRWVYNGCRIMQFSCGSALEVVLVRLRRRQSITAVGSHACQLWWEVGRQEKRFNARWIHLRCSRWSYSYLQQRRRNHHGVVRSLEWYYILSPWTRQYDFVGFVGWIVSCTV